MLHLHYLKKPMLCKTFCLVCLLGQLVVSFSHILEQEKCLGQWDSQDVFETLCETFETIFMAEVD